MTFPNGWLCKVCWKGNSAEDPICYRCGAPRDADDDEIDARRAILAADAAWPEEKPDIFIALPLVIFRGYARIWQRGGIGVMGLLLLFASGTVTDLRYLLLTGGLGAGTFIIGMLAGEVSEAMRDREGWAFVAGIVLAVVGLIASILAFQALAPDLASPVAIAWGSILVFGGAGMAALAGLVLLHVGRGQG